MNALTANKIKTLLAVITANYRASGHWKPELAAQTIVEVILNQYKSQAAHLDQLLDEEIEDAQRA